MHLITSASSIALIILLVFLLLIAVLTSLYYWIKFPKIQEYASSIYGKIKLNSKVKANLSEDRCLLFAEQKSVLLSTTNERIQYLLKEKKKVLLISSSFSFKGNLNVSYYRFSLLLDNWKNTKGLLERSANFDSVVICGKVSEVESLIDVVIENHDNVFVALPQNSNKVFECFEKSGEKFVLLDFKDKFRATIKTFEKVIPESDSKQTAPEEPVPTESIDENKTEPIKEVKLDLKLKFALSEELCLVFAKEIPILVATAEERIKLLSKKNKKVLVVSSVLNCENNSNLKQLDLQALLDNDNNSFSDFKSDFDSVVICCEYLVGRLRSFTNDALKNCDSVFVSVSEQTEDILEEFKKINKGFVLLDLREGLTSVPKVFEKAIPVQNNDLTNSEPKPVASKPASKIKSTGKKAKKTNDKFKPYDVINKDEEEDLLLRDVEESISLKKTETFDASINKEISEDIPLDDEDISGGLF